MQVITKPITLVKEKFTLTVQYPYSQLMHVYYNITADLVDFHINASLDIARDTRVDVPIFVIYEH